MSGTLIQKLELSFLIKISLIIIQLKQLQLYYYFNLFSIILYFHYLHTAPEVRQLATLVDEFIKFHCLWNFNTIIDMNHKEKGVRFPKCDIRR